MHGSRGFFNARNRQSFDRCHSPACRDAIGNVGLDEIFPPFHRGPVAGGELEGACPGHNFTIARIFPTSRARQLQSTQALSRGARYLSNSGSLAMFTAIRRASSQFLPLFS
jgi:hypothetical protein